MLKMTTVLLAAMIPLTGCSGSNAQENGSRAEEAPEQVEPPADSNWTETVAQTDDGGFRMGNPEASIKLIEYGSRTCPACARFDAEGLAPLKQQFISTGRVSYEYREYPIHGALDLAPSLLGTCVEPEAFFPMLDQMMANQSQFLDKTQSLPQKQLAAIQNEPGEVATLLAEQLGYLDFVKARGLSETQARACLTDEARIKAFADNAQRGQSEFGVGGTPTFILNGEKVDVNSWSGVREALIAAGAR